MIYCFDPHGKTVPVSPNALEFAPAVYGILIDEYDQVLLQQHPTTSFLFPPGGILEPQDTPSQAVRGHIRRLTGLTPRVGDLLLTEDLYQVSEDEHAYHLIAAYYLLERPQISMVPTETEEAADVRWVGVADLARAQMWFGYNAIQAARWRTKRGA